MSVVSIWESGGSQIQRRFSAPSLQSANCGEKGCTPSPSVSMSSPKRPVSDKRQGRRVFSVPMLHASSEPPVVVVPPVPPPLVLSLVLVAVEVVPPAPVVVVPVPVVLVPVVLVPVVLVPVVLVPPVVPEVLVLGPFVAELVSLPSEGSLHANPRSTALAMVEICIKLGTRSGKRMTVNVRS